MLKKDKCGFIRQVNYSKTCDEGTLKCLNWDVLIAFLWTKIYFNIEMYLWWGDTCHVGTLFEVSPRHRFYCIMQNEQLWYFGVVLKVRWSNKAVTTSLLYYMSWSWYEILCVSYISVTQRPDGQCGRPVMMKMMIYIYEMPTHSYWKIGDTK